MMRIGIRELIKTGLAIAILLVACSLAALAVNNGGDGQKSFVTGELMITVSPAMTRADVENLATSVNGSVIESFGTVDLKGTQAAYRIKLNNATDATTLAAVQTLKTSGKVIYAGVNRIYYPTQTSSSSTTASATPNDPMFVNQWNLQMINMPAAWTIEKGASNVVIAVVDTGVDITHPEFPANRVLPGINTINVPSLNSPMPVGGSIHGTHVAGIAMAQANNGIGIAGVVWDNVQLLPVCAGTDTAGFTSDSVVRALQFVLAQKNASGGKSFVVNMSLGGDVPSDTPDPNNLSPDEQEIMTLAGNHIMFCLAAGNGYVSDNNSPFSPAYLTQLDPVHIICVAACGSKKEHSAYSEARPYTTLTAPGGNPSSATDTGEQILSTVPVAAGSYEYEQGTSMATPHVTGAAALLLSVPGVTPEMVTSTLKSTCQPGTTPDPDHSLYGAGIIDVNAALQKVASGVTIIQPLGTGGKADLNLNAAPPAPIETLSPVVQIRVYQLPQANITITLDGNNLPFTQSNITSTVPAANPVNNIIYQQFDIVINNLKLSAGTHTITVSGVNPAVSTVTVTDTRTFVIIPHQINAGLQFISIPYYTQGMTPESIFGTNFSLARWVNSQSGYTFYSPSTAKNPLASFNPPGYIPHADGQTTNIAPIGLGYFANFPNQVPVITYGQPINNQSVIIPLQPSLTPGTGRNVAVGWNMIGDPFPYSVPFNSCLIDAPEGRLTIAEAADKGYILPTLYSTSSSGGYQVDNLPNGTLQEWQGNWVGVTTSLNISLVVPALAPTRAAVSHSNWTSFVGSGWWVKMGASVGNMRDNNVIIGESSRATDDLNSLDVIKPPALSPYVTVGTVHTNWGNRSGMYQMDMRSQTGKKSWDVQVNTDQKNANVTFAWDSSGLPRNVNLTIRDNVTGQVRDMRSVSSLAFQTTSTSLTRAFTIQATPSTGNTVKITNISVGQNGGRASGIYAIGFTLSGDASVNVSILNASGQPISQLVSRAAQAGTLNMIWNGQDSAGRSVPMGMYLVQIRALTSDGDVVKAIQPFTVMR